jgi:hypothetical protein
VKHAKLNGWDPEARGYFPGTWRAPHRTRYRPPLKGAKGKRVFGSLRQTLTLDLADQVRQFTKEMQPAYVDREWIAADIMSRLRTSTLQRPRAHLERYRPPF